MAINEYLLPGERVMPEGIVLSPDGGSFFATSSADGTIYRCDLDEDTAQIWHVAGADGRQSALGMAVHNGRSLIVCGGRTGTVFLYDIATKALLAKAETGGFPNDVCVIGDDAYVTDSSRPVVWRWNLTDAPEALALAEAGDDAYLNGIVPTPSGEALLVSAQGTGVLWRLEIDGKAQHVIGDFAADGLLMLNDHTLYGVCNVGETHEDAVFFLSTLELLDDGRQAKQLGRFEDPRFDTPATLDTDGERLLIVNAQFCREIPGPPFQVIAVQL